MIPFDTSSLCLLAAILTPLSAGLILLFGARFSQSSLRAVSVVGFATPLIIALALYCQFEPSLIGGYNFELRLATGLEAVGIYLANRRAKAQNPSSEISSARAVGSRPASRSADSMSGAADFRLERSILRR